MRRGRHNPVTPVEARAMREMRAAGKSVPEIMAHFDRSSGAVWNAVQGMTLKVRGSPTSQEIIAQIVRMAADGMSAMATATALSISGSTVKKYLRQHRGEVTRTKQRSAIQAEQARCGGSVPAEPRRASNIKLEIRIPEHVQRMRVSLELRGVPPAAALEQAMRFYARGKAGSAVDGGNGGRAAGGGVRSFHAKTMPAGRGA